MHTSIFSQFLTMKLKMNKCIKNFKIFLIFLTICVCGSSLIKYCLNTPVHDSNLKQNLEKFYNRSERSSFDSILTRTPRRFAVISVNLFSEHNYLFNLPMIGLAWRRLGIEPVILLVHSPAAAEPDRRATKTIEFLNKLKIKHILVKSVDNYDIMVAMLARLYVGLLPDDLIDENDFVLTSDSDLIPISKRYYSIDNSNKIRVWNAYCCRQFKFKNKRYQMYPISHIGMRKFQWKEMMSLDSAGNYKLDGDTILKITNELIDDRDYIKQNDQIRRGSRSW